MVLVQFYGMVHFLFHYAVCLCSSMLMLCNISSSHNLHSLSSLCIISWHKYSSHWGASSTSFYASSKIYTWSFTWRLHKFSYVCLLGNCCTALSSYILASQITYLSDDVYVCRTFYIVISSSLTTIMLHQPILSSYFSTKFR